ncbi:MAG: hypothetical protein IJ776_01830 [Paludibacteraceae bacterium]|nr:hypothetical protein [Paludibacteraceae bacterium]
METDRAWTGKTGGTKRMQQSLIRIFSRVSPRWLYPLVAVWVLGYIFFAPQGTRAIYYYWRKRQRRGIVKSCVMLYRNYFEFGKVILDRFAAYSGRKFNVKTEGKELIDKLQNQSGGFIVISSHIGNQELAGYVNPSKKPMCVLLWTGDTDTVNTNRERMFNKMGLYFLPMQKDGGHIFAMHEALSRGEILSIHGDRMFYGGRTLTAPLLGENTEFPEGPYRVAAIEKVPVITMFMMREKADTYTLYIRELATGKETGNATEQAKVILNKFTDEMGKILNKYPLQWFHFYQFWHTGDR